MDIKNIIKKLKETKIINTLVGEFSFIEQIGEGGNSNVCLYKKNNIDFAVKFFSKGTENSAKTKRFIDEYFGMAQIPSHPNIAQYFHLDSITLDDDSLMIIIMKRYKSSLKETLEEETDKSVYADKIRALFENLLNAIEHLHAHGIIHRDIKPENILIDDVNNRYVLSDFGISKFDPENIAKEAETKDGERLANYRYCAPEQRGNKVPASISSDLYSFAQVIQEFATGDIIQGGGRTQLRFQDEEFIRIVDKVITRCLMHEPEKRFSSVDELKKFMDQESESYKSEMMYMEREKEYSASWEFLYKLNVAIARGFPTVNTTGEITDPAKMVRFFESIDETIRDEENKNRLWMIQSNGGDLNYYGANHISGNDFEINYGCFLHQARISKILVNYNDTRPYGNYFIILVDGMEHFEYSDTTHLSTKKTRTYLPKEIDESVIWEGYILDPQDTKNMYVEIEGTVYENNRDSFKPISRFIAPEALLVSPTGVFGYGAKQNDHAETLLTNCIRDTALSMDSVREYWKGVGGKYSSWITSRL
ncbi:protein kinase domain-containing protein [Serratia proteamaculans]